MTPTAQDVAALLTALPSEVQRRITCLALPLMSIDQRRAARVTPKKLSVPNEFQQQLAAAIRISRPVHVRFERRVSDDRTERYDAAAAEVVRIAPQQAQHVKTCRVLAVDCRWHEFDDDNVCQAVLTGVAPWFPLPSSDMPSLSIFLVV